MTGRIVGSDRRLGPPSLAIAMAMTADRPLWPSVRAEVVRLASGRLTRALLTCEILAVAAVYGVVWGVSTALQGRPEIDEDVLRLRESLALPRGLPFALLAVHAFGTPFAIVFAAASAGGPAPVGSRLARAVAIIGLAAVGLTIGLTAALAVSLLVGTTIQRNASDGLGAGFPAEASLGLARTVFVALPFVAAATLAGSLDKLRGVLGGLALFFGEPLVSSLLAGGGGWLQDVPRFLLNDNVQTIMRQNGVVAAYETGRGSGSADFVRGLPGIGHAALLLSVYAALPLVATSLAGRASQRQRPGSR